MKKQSKKNFVQLLSPEPSADLFDRIWRRIHREKDFLILRRRVVVFSVGLMGSTLALVPTTRLMQSELAGSGLMTMLSLFFSDLDIVMLYWQSFALAILESLPIVSLLVFFSLVFISLGLLKFLSGDAKKILVLAK